MKEQTVSSDNSAAVKEVLEQTDSFRIISDTFRNLGDATRVRIFWLLCHEEKCVIDIASMLEMSSPAVSHHLKALKKSGLIISRREGKEVFYHASHYWHPGYRVLGFQPVVVPDVSVRSFIRKTCRMKERT